MKITYIRLNFKTMENKRLRIAEAMANHTLRTGNRLTKSELVKIVWPGSSIKSGLTVLAKYEKGELKRADINFIHKMCEICYVDANFLLGIKEM